MSSTADRNHRDTSHPCPFCRAQPGERCTTRHQNPARLDDSTGRPTQTHAARRGLADAHHDARRAAEAGHGDHPADLGCASCARIRADAARLARTRGQLAPDAATETRERQTGVSRETLDAEAGAAWAEEAARTCDRCGRPDSDPSDLRADDEAAPELAADYPAPLVCSVCRGELWTERNPPAADPAEARPYAEHDGAARAAATDPDAALLTAILDSSALEDCAVPMTDERGGAWYAHVRTPDGRWVFVTVQADDNGDEAEADWQAAQQG